MVLAAALSAAALHSSSVFPSTSQPARRGAPMSFCISGLTSVGTGRLFAGTCKGAGAVSLLCAAPREQAGTTHARMVQTRAADLVMFMIQSSPVASIIQLSALRIQCEA